VSALTPCSSRECLHLLRRSSRRLRVLLKKLSEFLCEEMSAVIVAEKKESMVVSFVKRKPIIVLEEIDEDDV